MGLVPYRTCFSRQRSHLRILVLLVVTLVIVLVMGKAGFDHSRQDIGGCLMTYSLPQYHVIPTNNSNVRFTKYKLYLYRDGQYDLNPNQLYGTPVLFLHGNAGSHEQIRSLAKVTSKLAQQLGKPSLDFFAADFDEELSALVGQLLLNQADYVNLCISNILQLYSGSAYSTDPSVVAPSSVIIIGHSMGGIVARTVFIRPSYVNFTINTILTLSSPHLAPRLPLERGMWELYEELTEFWRRKATDIKNGGSNLLSDVSLISVTGGNMDSQINSDLTEVSTLVLPENGFTVFTTTLPKAWLAVDHVAILWCNQVLNSLASTLLNIVTLNSPERTLKINHRMSVFSNQLLDSPVLSRKLTLEIPYTTCLIYPDSFQLDADRDILIPLAKQKKDIINIIAYGVTELYLCRNQNETGGSECSEITSESTSIPATDYAKDANFGSTYYEFWSINKQDYHLDSFVYIRMDSDPSFKNFISITTSDQENSNIEITPSIWDLLFGLEYQLPKPEEKPEEKPEGKPALNSVPIFYFKWHFRLPDSGILAYKLTIKNTKSSVKPSIIVHQLNRLMHESKFWVTSTNDRPIFVNFHGLPNFPTQDHDHKKSLPSLPNWRGAFFRAFIGLPLSDPVARLDYDDSFRIGFHLDVYGTLGRVFKRVDLSAVAFPHGIALLAVRNQFMVKHNGQNPVSFMSSLQLFSRFQLGMCMVIGFVLSMFQNWYIKALSLPGEHLHNLMLFHFHPENWFIGNLGLATSWVVPLLIFVSIGCTVAHQLILSCCIILFKVTLFPVILYNKPVNKEPCQTIQFYHIVLLGLFGVSILFIPHPIIYLSALVILIGRASYQTYSKSPDLANRIDVSICHLLLSAGPVHIPWSIVYFKDLARGAKTIPFRGNPILPETVASVIYSIPLVLFIVFPPTNKKLQCIAQSPTLAWITSNGLLFGSAFCFLFGVYYTFTLPEINLILITWIWAACFLLNEIKTN